METVDFNQITNMFQHTIVETENEALALAYEQGWEPQDICSRNNGAPIRIEINGKIGAVNLPHLFTDSGSDDYIYFVKF